MSAMQTRVENVSDAGREPRDAEGRQRGRFPVLLTVDEAADLLRITRRAIYATIERRHLPVVIRIRRRVLLGAADLPHWLDQKRAPSPEESLAMSVTIRPLPEEPLEHEGAKDGEQRPTWRFRKISWRHGGDGAWARRNDQWIEQLSWR